MGRYTIKNKAELVRRAEWHAKHDHVKQGTYGSVTSNGKVEFKGCAITCLAVPHTRKGLREYAERWSTRDLYSYRLLEDLTKEFGIHPALAMVAEAVFETLPAHGAAISWVPQFARALPEGASITKRDVRKFLATREKLIKTYDGVDDVNWNDVEKYGVDKFRREVVRWLRSLA